MTTSKKHKLLIIISVLAALVVGLIFGFLLGKNADALQKLFVNEKLYRASCTIYIESDADTLTSSISSSDLVLDNWTFQGFSSLLRYCYPEIQQNFPDVAFELSLERIENTNMCCIVVTGEDPYVITDICNLATTLWLEKAESMLDYISCKVVEQASVPSAPIE